MLKKLFLYITLLSSFIQAQATGPALLTEDGKTAPALIEITRLFDMEDCEDWNSLLAYSQTYWLQRGLERWDFPQLSENRLSEFTHLFQELGLMDEVGASKTEYTYALLLGSTESNMKERIAFLISEWKRGVRFSCVALLTGERALDPKIEPATGAHTTEAELLMHLWNTMASEELQQLPLIIVNSPKREGQTRPTTADTVIDFVASSPQAGSCLAFSSQPFVGYQQSVLKTHLPSTFSIETIGPARKFPASMSIYLDTIAKWLYQENIRFAKE